MKNLQIKTITLLLILITTTVAFAQQDVFVSDRGNNAINRYDIDGNFIEVFVNSNSGGLSNPQDIIFHPDGTLIVSGLGNNTLKQYDGNTGEYLGDWSQGFSLGAPSKMGVGPDNLIYVTQWGTTGATSKVVTFSLDDGSYQGPFTPSAPQALGMLWDDNGDYYLALYGQGINGVVRKYDVNGNYIEDFIDSVELQGPTYIWFEEGTGDMLVEDWPMDRVLRYDANGTYIEEFITNVSRPEGIAFLPNGNFLICERGANKVTEFDPLGTEVGRWDNGGVLNTPNFVIIREPNFGIEDNVTTKTMVTPSVGNRFLLNPTLVQDFNSLQVYTINGRLIDTIALNKTVLWETSNLADGLYLLVAVDLVGNRITQKIIVQK